MTKTSVKKASGAKRPTAVASRRTTILAHRSKPTTPPTDPPENAKTTKMDALIQQLRHGRGASLPEIAEATGWQHHSIRGAISGHIKKKLGLKVASARDDEGVRRYRIAG